MGSWLDVAQVSAQASLNWKYLLCEHILLKIQLDEISNNVGHGTESEVIMLDACEATVI
jgi:hypothetical protein